MGNDTDDVSDVAFRFVEANSKRYALANDSDDYRCLTRDMWRAARDALIQAQKGHSLDQEIVGWLSQSIDEVLDNRCPLEIKHARNPKVGTSLNSPDIIEAIRYAVLYKQAVEAGDIKNRSPTKTLAAKYGCSHQTTREWVKKYPSVHWDDYLPERTLDQRIDGLMRLLNRSAKHFREHSRSQVAIENRNSKRQSN